MPTLPRSAHAPRQRQHPHPRQRQRGAALLLAMLIVTLVSTLAAGMVWQQWRAFEVESAERARVQSSWLLAGALDWARLILREDARDGGADGLTEPWATGLEEIRLSTFLAADKDNNTDTGLDAFLSGGIQDAQARYNLRNLLEPNAEQAKVELAILSRLCNTLGLPGGLAAQLADSLRASAAAENQLAESGSNGGSGGNNNQAGASPLLPQRVEQLVWLGLDNATLARLRPYVVMLPQRTPVNINTAPAEVLMAVIDGLDRASAQRLIQHRATLKKGFDQLTAAKALLPDKITLPPRHLSVTSNHFEVSGQLRYEDSVLREISLVQRNGMDVRVLRRDRLPLDASADPAKVSSVYPNPTGPRGVEGGAAT